MPVAGSVKGEGGRFNDGASLSPGAFTPFPALYLAEDYVTAYRERFGQAMDAKKSALDGQELALRTRGSFTQVRLRGRLDLVLDVGDPAALKPLIDVIEQFELPKDVARLSHQLRLRRPPVRRDGKQCLVLFPQNWRGTGCVVEVADPPPSRARLVRLDATTGAAEWGYKGYLCRGTRDEQIRL